MATPHNYALYYPTIEFSDYTWLWSAALLWDRIYRIVPDGYEPKDCRNVRILAEDGEIGLPIRPKEYAPKVAKEFIEKLESREWSASALVHDIPAEYARLHSDKVDVKLRNLIIARGVASAQGDWLHVPTQFEALYMTFLANRIAEECDLQLLSDSQAAWSGSTFFRLDGKVKELPSEDLAEQLATLVIRDFLPSNITDISPKDLLSFRKKYRDERRRFVNSMHNAAEQLANCRDPGVMQDHVVDLKLDIEAALKDYRRSMESLRVVAYTGIKSVTFPVATQMACTVIGLPLDTSTLTVISALGVGLGLVCGLLDLQDKSRKLEKECDYSYLLHLGRNWTGCAMYGLDYNYMLCRTMEEFLND